MKHWTSAALVTSVAWLCAAPVHAHFKLLEPASWLNEDAQGGPQKGSPCGPGNTRPFIGDDVQPIPKSDAVTTYHAGEKLTVKWQETVYHPGYFRISIAKAAASDATNKDFPDPALTDTENCHYDHALVQTEPHGDVLADGLYMASDISGANRSLEQEVTLPDEPCEHCALQVVQVMEGHPAASCFYFHCADIQIVAKERGADASAGGATSDAGQGGAAGKGGTGKDAGTSGRGSHANTKHDDGGCSIASLRSAHGILAGCLLGFAWLYRRRRAR